MFGHVIKCLPLLCRRRHDTTFHIDVQRMKRWVRFAIQFPWVVLSAPLLSFSGVQQQAANEGLSSIPPTAASVSPPPAPGSPQAVQPGTAGVPPTVNKSQQPPATRKKPSKRPTIRRRVAAPPTKKPTSKLAVKPTRKPARRMTTRKPARRRPVPTKRSTFKYKGKSWYYDHKTKTFQRV